MLYTLIIAVQFFCLYHAYSRQAPFWWYFIIFIFPMVGGLIYLFVHFYNQSTLDTIEHIADEVKDTIDTGHRTRKLKKQLDFSETAENKLKLGGEYLDKGYYDDAYELFKSCNKGVFENDPEVLSRLVETSFLLHDYDATIQYGEQPKFQNDLQINDQKSSLAWAYHYKNHTDKANLIFSSFDKSYGNYYLRHEFIKYLIITDQGSVATDKMSELMEEINLMDRSERRINAYDISAIKKTANSL